jgi:hypothetical protein
MYLPPTIYDFQRNLDTLIHSGEQEAGAKVGEIKSRAAAHGTLYSTGVITASISSFDEIHKSVIERAMQLIGDFSARSAELVPTVLAGAARPRLTSFETFLLTTIPTLSFPGEVQQFRARYAAVFRQRLDGELRNIEIGFIRGRNLVTPEPMVLNNIRIDNSVVGSINTGNVRAIDVSLTHLRGVGNDTARDGLKALTEAIINDTSMPNAQKNELIEQVAFLSEQATVHPEMRKPGLIKPTLSALNEAAGTVQSIAGAWEIVAPILRSLFG